MNTIVAKRQSKEVVVKTPSSTMAILIPKKDTINVYSNTNRAFLLNPTQSAGSRAALDSRYLQLLEDHIKGASHLTEGDRESIARNYKNLTELYDSVFDKDGYFTDRIRPLSIETKYLTVGSKIDRLTLVGVTFSANVGGSPNACAWTSGIIWHFALPDDAGATWQLKAGSYTIPDDSLCYIYATAPKSRLGEATLDISKDKKATETESSYNILLGVVHSVIDGYRDVTFTYGQTTIVGENITSGTIRGNNGNGLIINLNTGEIAGKITILPGSPALTAIKAAENAAEKASTSVSELNTYVDGAFKDGVISEAEAKAIEKYKAQITANFNDVIATYNIIYSNAYLEGTAKSDLLNAKVTLAGAKDNLLGSITTAISDGKTTQAEKNDVDAKYALWDSALSTYKSKLEAANKAIQNKLKSYSDIAAQDAANAKQQLVDMASDGILSPVEKKDLVQRYNNIISEQVGIDAEAANIGITTEKEAYDSAIAALTAYLNTLTSPVAWSSLSGNTAIDKAVFSAKFNDVYAARQVLFNRLYRGVKDTAEQNAKDAVAKNLGYADFDELNDKAIAGETILEGGKLRNNMVDTDALFAQQIAAKNMIVLGGKVGDFDIASKLIGSGYTNGVLNGNQIILDPSNNEVVLAKNGVKRVRLTNNALTPLAELKADGGTVYCTNASAAPVKKTSTLALQASRNDIGVGGAGLSHTNAVGIVSNTPTVYNTIDEAGKVALQPAFYSLDFPYVVNIVHSGDTRDGRYNRIIGKNTCNVQVSLVSTSGIVSSYNDEFEMSVDTYDSGKSIAYNRMARFNFSVSSAAKYWVVTTFTIVGSDNPIHYQSYNHATTFRHSWWSNENDWDVQYELSVASGMSIDGSIGITELSNSGFQSVWTDHRFIRIDGNTNNTTFIESQGKWMHNGVEIKFDTATITGYIDPSTFATKNYVDTGFLLKTEGMLKTDTAADSNKLGGQLPSYYYNASNANLDSVNWRANLLSANNINVSGYTRSIRNGAPAYVGNWAGTNWWGIGEYDSTTVQLAQVASDMSFNGDVANFRVSGSITATSGIYGAIYGDTFIKDTRDTVFATPNDTKAYSVQWDFKPGTITGLTGANYWTSVMTVKGWDSNYAVAQMFFPATVANSTDLFYRTGQGTTWNSIVPIWTGYNLNRSDTDFNARHIVSSSLLPANIIALRTGGDPNQYGATNGNYPVRAFEAFGWNFTVQTVGGNGQFSITNAAGDNKLFQTRENGTSYFRNGIQSFDYSGSGFTATNWQITNDGDANFRNHTVRGKLTTYEFVQNKISIANGNMIVSDNAKCATAQRVYYNGKHIFFTFNSDDKCPFKAGDIIKCQSNGKLYQVTVDYVFPDLLSCNAYNEDAVYDANVVANGDLLVRWDSSDATRKGLLYLCSSDAGSPNYQVIYDGAVKAQFGNLEGRAWLGSTLLANTWGLWAENAYLSGAINATSGKIGRWEIGSTFIRNSSKKIVLDDISNSIYVEKPTGGYVMLGQTFANGSWTGKYGFSATDASNRELFRIDDEVCRFAGGAISFTATDVTFSDSVKLQWQSGARNYVKDSKINIASNDYGFATRSVDLIGGEVYTLSANGRCNNVSSGKSLRVFLYNQDWSWNTTVDITATSDMTSKGTFTAPSTGTYFITSYYHDYSYPREGTVTINWYKVEKGYNATDWTPALEDVDSKLTRIGPDGLYAGKIKAENIEGDLLSGKTINAVNASNATILQLHGKDGTLTGFDDNGLIQSQLSRGSLTFFDSVGNPAIFLRNSTISLSECQNSGSLYVAAAGDVAKDGVKYSDPFSISYAGAYKGTVSISLSVSGVIDIIDCDAVYDVINCSVSVSSSVSLEYYNSSTNTWEAYINGVAYASIYNTTSNTSASASATKNISLGFTTNKTGTFRFRFTHTSNCYGNARNSTTRAYYDAVVDSLSSSVSNDAATSASRVSNGTYIGNNGFISYNGSGGESFVVFDRSDGVQFQVKANTDIISTDNVMKLSMRDGYVDVVVNGSTTLRVNNSGRIFIYGAPAVSTNVNGTGSSRYRLYLDEYNQLCRRPDSGW